MTVIIMPDLDKALIAFLLGRTELDALVNNRIYGELPAGVVYPALTLRTISSRANAPRWLEAATVEVAGWTHRDVVNARSTAHTVCETAVALLNTLENEVLGNVVVAGPVATTGPTSIPDAIASGVTNPRYIADVSFTFHP